MLLELLPVTTGSATVDHIGCQLGLLGPLLEKVRIANQVIVLRHTVLQNCSLLLHLIIHHHRSWRLLLLMLIA